MAVPKKLRARRARSHWRGRGHDLREHYREGDLPPAPDLAIVEFPDPYAPSGWVNPDGTLDPNARRRPARVCTENSNSDIMVMQSAKDRVGMDTSSSLNWARERRVLI